MYLHVYLKMYLFKLVLLYLHYCINVETFKYSYTYVH